MAKLVTKKTTTTVTEEVELIPATPGEEINHRYMKVCGYGSYRGDDGESVDKPQIVLNAKQYHNQVANSPLGRTYL